MIFHYDVNCRRMYSDPVLQWCRENALDFCCRRRYPYIVSYRFKLTEEDIMVLKLKFNVDVIVDMPSKPSFKKVYSA